MVHWPPEREQVAPGFPNVPEPSVEKVTVPVDVDEPAPFVSRTVAVQVVVAPASTGDGEQLTLVDVVRVVMLKLVEVACV